MTLASHVVNPMPRPTAINITNEQHALSEHNEFNDHNELNDHSNLLLNDHKKDVSVERVNMHPPSNDALIVLMTPPLLCDKTIVDDYQVS